MRESNTRLPIVEPTKQTAEYIAAVKKSEVISLDVLGASARTFARDVNSALQQAGLWQRELRDAQFDEKNPELVQRIGNCDQRQEAFTRTLNEIARSLNLLRSVITDLRNDQTELVRCTTDSAADTAGGREVAS